MLGPTLQTDISYAYKKKKEKKTSKGQLIGLFGGSEKIARGFRLGPITGLAR